MSRNRKFLIWGVVLLAIGIAAFVNFWIWPFSADNPNFSDVERVYSRIQVPVDWKEISSSENRGTAGRTCPIEPDTRCFSKGRRWTVPIGMQSDIAEQVFKSLGCDVVSRQRSEVIDGDPYTNFECNSDGLIVDGSLIESKNGWEISVYVSTE